MVFPPTKNSLVPFQHFLAQRTASLAIPFHKPESPQSFFPLPLLWIQSIFKSCNFIQGTISHWSSSLHLHITTTAQATNSVMWTATGLATRLPGVLSNQVSHRTFPKHKPFHTTPGLTLSSDLTKPSAWRHTWPTRPCWTSPWSPGSLTPAAPDGWVGF